MKIMNEEVKKWTISAREVLLRMTETRDKLSKDLKHNQNLWNDLLHDKEWNQEKLELSCQYIKAINSLIDTVNKINNIKLAPEEEKSKK